MFSLDFRVRTFPQARNESFPLNNTSSDKSNGEKEIDGDIEVIDKATTRDEDVPIVNKRQAGDNEDFTKQSVSYHRNRVVKMVEKFLFVSLIFNFERFIKAYLL